MIVSALYMFIPCIIDNIMMLNLQNAQTSSLDIVSHPNTFIYFSPQGQWAGNQTK